MPVVTSLKLQRDGKRVNVYLDGKFAFGIDLDNLVKFGIKIEREFSQDEIDKIIHEAEFAKTYNKLLNFATLRPRSEKELFSWLKRKKVPESLHKKLFSKLKRLDLVDDTKFSKWWIEQRMQFKFKSRKELKYELTQKGIDRNTLENILAESDLNEAENARKLLEKKKFTDPQKAFTYLARKGFDFNIIKSVVRPQDDLDP
jgi:regulatory protein